MTSHSRELGAATVVPPRLDQHEIDALLELRLIAKLGTIDPDGGIHIVPMWFLRDGDAILIPTSQHTRKYRNVVARPRASVMVDISRAGLDLRGILIRGAVEILRGDRARMVNRRIHERYVKKEGLELPAVAAYLQEGDDVTLKVRIEKVVTWNNAASPAGRELIQSGASHPLDG